MTQGASAITLPSRFQPVVGIEVDGLLAVPATYSGQVIEEEITMSRHAYPRVTQSEPRWDEDGTWASGWRFSRLGREWVADLLTRGVEVVWASTWLEHANTTFSPVLGLPSLPVVLTEENWTGPTVGDAKVRQIARRFDDRPLLLITELPPLQGRSALPASRRPQDHAVTRLHVIPYSTGVSERDIATLNHWLDLAQSPHGHEELRRLRRRDLARARRAAKRSNEASATPPPPADERGEALRRLTDRYASLYPSGYLDDVRDGWPG